ncbi:MAG TPA: ABC transporter ATP-binding protein [Firmicutes bacterium]|nr:ABC transporter ATP-binding protein [Bacillota bacterium]
MIRLESISKCYDRGGEEVWALADVNLTIQRGEFISVMGPSGSGKSTLLHILGGLDQATSGAYLLEEVDITELSDKELSRIRNRHFGFIFQAYNLLPELTALENVAVPMMYGGKGKREWLPRAKELLERMGLSQRLHHYPNQLSGGEQQRVAIARALANEPTLLLADEPTGNLASDQGEEILRLLQELNDQGTTIVLVTHDPWAASFGKRLIRLRDGRIIQDREIANRFTSEEILQDLA